MKIVPSHGVCGHTDQRIFRLKSALRVLMHRRRVSGRVVQLIGGRLSFGAIASRGALSLLDSVYKFAAKHSMSCGIPCDSLKFELRAYAGLLPHLKGDWINSWCPEVSYSDNVVLCDAHNTGFSRRASWLCSGTLSLSLSSRQLTCLEIGALTTKGGSFLAFEAFFALSPRPVFTYPAQFVDVLAFVLSTSAREKPSSSLIRDSGLGDVVQREVCSRSPELHENGHLTSRLASARAKQVVHGSCSLCLTQQKILAPSTTNAVTYNTTFSQSKTRFHKTSRFTVFWSLNREVGLIIFCSTSLASS